MEENREVNKDTDFEQKNSGVSSVKNNRIKQMRRMIASSIALIITTVIIFSVQTVAYFTDGSESNLNIINSGKLTVKVVESTLSSENDSLISYPEAPINIMPTTKVSKIVTVYNTGNIEAWVRIKVDKTVTSVESGNEMDVDTDMFSCDYNTEYWTFKDGYWYYNIPLKAGEITKPLFRTITFASEMDNTYQNSVITFQITANAVQKNSNGDSALDAVWTEDGSPNN